MPDLIAKEPVEDFKLTPEHKAFYKNYKRITEVSKMIQQGLQFQFGKVEALRAIAQEIEGQKKQLLLKAPDQSVLDVEDEGMVEFKTADQANRGAAAQQTGMQQFVESDRLNR